MQSKWPKKTPNQPQKAFPSPSRTFSYVQTRKCQ